MTEKKEGHEEAPHKGLLRIYGLLGHRATVVYLCSPENITSCSVFSSAVTCPESRLRVRYANHAGNAHGALDAGKLRGLQS
jgi:hypothetical protein